MQGMTAEPGLVAHWTSPPRLDYDIKWLICYVILSRVPSLPQLMSISLSDKIRAIIEGGPPDTLVQVFNTLFQEKIEQTFAAARATRYRLGWTRLTRQIVTATARSMRRVPAYHEEDLLFCLLYTSDAADE